MSGAAKVDGSAAALGAAQGAPPAAPDARAAAAWQEAGRRRLLFVGDALPGLRLEAAGPRAEQFARLVEECRRAARTARLPARHPPESVTWVGIGAMNHALLWLLTGQRRWLDEARRWIAAAVGWPDWGHLFLVNVDLSAAWLLWGLGLCLDWLRGALPAGEEEALARELERHARIMREYKRETEGEGWSTNWWQNHNWINLNGLATAAYALRGRCPEAEEWIACARGNFRIVLSELAPDGSDYEGAAYWRYGVPWLFAYAQLERERGGEDFFASSPFLRETFWYRLYQAVPGEEETVNFGDCHDARSAHSIALYYKAAAEWRVPQARWLADRARSFLFREQYESGIRPGILPEAGLEYLWFDPSVEPEGPGGLPLSRFFPDLGLLSARDSWRPDATLFSVKCGAPGGERQWRRSWEVQRERGWTTRGLSHVHPDDCAFVIHSRGAYLACDEGYSREVMTAHHNAITVDGRGYEGEGANNVWKDRPEERIARLELCEHEGARFSFRGDRALCYPRELGVKRCARSIASAGDGVFVVLDEVEAEEPRTFEWNFHAECASEELPGGTLRYANGRAALHLTRVRPAAARVESFPTEVRAVMTPQEPDKVRVARLESLRVSNPERARAARFLFVLSAEDAFGEPAEVRWTADGGSIRIDVEGSGFAHRYLVRDGRIDVLAPASAGRPEGRTQP